MPENLTKTWIDSWFPQFKMWKLNFYKDFYDWLDGKKKELLHWVVKESLKWMYNFQEIQDIWVLLDSYIKGSNKPNNLINTLQLVYWKGWVDLDKKYKVISNIDIRNIENWLSPQIINFFYLDNHNIQIENVWNIRLYNTILWKKIELQYWEEKEIIELNDKDFTYDNILNIKNSITSFFWVNESLHENIVFKEIIINRKKWIISYSDFIHDKLDYDKLCKKHKELSQDVNEKVKEYYESIYWRKPEVNIELWNDFFNMNFKNTEIEIVLKNWQHTATKQMTFKNIMQLVNQIKRMEENLVR